MQRDGLGGAITDLVLTTFRINGALLENGDKMIKPFGLTSAQWQVLGPIGFNKSPMTAPQIAKFIGISRQAVQKQLCLLKDKGLVVCTSNPYHERSPLYSLTEKGDKKYNAICEINNVSLEKLGHEFDLSELQIVLKVLNCFHRRLVEDNTLISKFGQ